MGVFNVLKKNFHSIRVPPRVFLKFHEKSKILYLIYCGAFFWILREFLED